jgi:hypothetical protein
MDLPNSLPSGVATSATKMTSCNSAFNSIQFIKQIFFIIFTYNKFIQQWMPKAV